MRKTEREELDGALARYATLAAERQSLVETFKSKNALLKNSVNYFPSLVADVLSRTRDPVFVAMVTELRGQTLNLALRDDARLSEAQRQSLSEVMASIPAEFDGTGRRTLELMLAHARVIAREKERTDSLLRQILDVPLDSAREGVSLRYQSYYARARTQAEVFGNAASSHSLLKFEGGGSTGPDRKIEVHNPKGTANEGHCQESGPRPRVDRAARIRSDARRASDAA